MRVEVEGDYAYNKVGGVHSAIPLRAGGDQQQYGGFLNAIYDAGAGLGLNLPVQPYAGVGVGYQEVSLQHINSTTAVPNLLSRGVESQGSFAYQGIVGFSYPVAYVPGLALTTEYRMIGVLSPPAYARSNGSANIVILNGVAQTSRSTVNNIFNHEILVGLRYAFNAAPPAVAAQPAPAPQINPARTYLVFFDWDRADLTDRAKQIIAEAAQQVTRISVTRIEVSGNTDTTGTAKYNLALSLRRAQSVATELVRLGVPQAAITTQGLGFSHLLVPTGPGVREPQNRRVEIVLK